MLAFKVLSVLGEGLIFGLVALGIYIAFRWLRFPDLTPDGSFALGGVIFTKSMLAGCPATLALTAALLAGALAGTTTAFVNQFMRVPTVVAGLLVASGLYSVNWMILGKPNQFLPRSLTLSPSAGVSGLVTLVAVLCLVVFFLIFGTWIYSGTIWGLKLRAIGENPLLAHDLGASERKYTAIGLGLANSIVGLGGAFFAQRSFSADVNMGVGITIAGLAGMTLGLVIASSQRKLIVLLLCVLAGSVLYKTATFLVLQFGLPAEAFRLVSSSVLLLAFLLPTKRQSQLLADLKWN